MSLTFLLQSLTSAFCNISGERCQFWEHEQWWCSTGFTGNCLQTRVSISQNLLLLILHVQWLVLGKPQRNQCFNLSKQPGICWSQLWTSQRKWVRLVPTYQPKPTQMRSCLVSVALVVYRTSVLISQELIIWQISPTSAHDLCKTRNILMLLHTANTLTGILRVCFKEFIVAIRASVGKVESPWPVFFLPRPISLTVAKCWDPTPRSYFTIPRGESIFVLFAGFLRSPRGLEYFQLFWHLTDFHSLQVQYF